MPDNILGTSDCKKRSVGRKTKNMKTKWLRVIALPPSALFARAGGHLPSAARGFKPVPMDEIKMRKRNGFAPWKWRQSGGTMITNIAIPQIRVTSKIKNGGGIFGVDGEYPSIESSAPSDPHLKISVNYKRSLLLMRQTRAFSGRRTPFWGLAAFAIIPMAFLGGCANKPQAGSSSSGSTAGLTGTPIIVGEYGSLTGPQSAFGTSTENGIQLALDQANRSGGISGHPVQLAEGHALDDESKKETTLTVINKMTAEDNPTAVLGEVASTLSLTAAPVCQRDGIPMISPSSTNPKVTQVGNYIFRVCFIDQFQGSADAQFAFNNLKARKVAVLTDITSDYSTGLTKFFTDNFQKQGGTVVSAQTYSAGALDYHAQLQQIKAAAPDLIFIPGYYNDIGPIAKQAREIGITVPLMGGDGWDSTAELVKGAGGPGGALEGCYFSDHFTVVSPDPVVKKFVTAYEAANSNTPPDAMAALGYDAAGVLIAAIKRVPAPADGNYASHAYRALVRDAIAATQNYPGVTGNITIGPNRNAVKPALILKIVGTQFKLAATIKPQN
jgi:branched-chain amino acid transport system substrate-binding protein